MGHLFRALSLRTAFADIGLNCLLMTNQDAATEAILTQRRVKYVRRSVDRAFPEQVGQLVQTYNVRMWVNDRLDTDRASADAISSLGIPIVTFDDFGAGAQVAELNIAALSFDSRMRIPGKRVLSGPDWIVLPAGIGQFRRKAPGRRNLVISMGGSDTHGASLEVIRKLDRNWPSVTIVLGPNFSNEAEMIATLPKSWVVKKAVPSLIHELLLHDVAVTGGGLTAFESASLGLPTLVVACENFEEQRAIFLERWGCARYVGRVGEISEQILNNPLDVEGMSAAGLRLPVHGARLCAGEIARMI